MKKTTNMIEYNLKGEVVNADEETILTQVTKKDSVEEDSLDLEAFVKDIVDFCITNKEKNIELKMSLKVVEE
jgi:hypothetical protein